MIPPGRCAAICASLVLSIGYWTAPAWSQATVPFDVTAPSFPSTAVIDSFVDAQAKEMASGDREKVVAARQALLLPGTPNKKSDAFLDAYSKAIGTKLMTIASGSDSHAKLNLGLVVGKVAEMSGSTDMTPLTPVVVKLIGDDAAPVSLYGIRAASTLVPRVLADKNLAANDKIVPAISAAMKKHATSEAIVSEAYLSMIRVLNSADLVKQLPAASVTAATPRVIDGLLDLMEDRGPQFGSGELVEPLAELPAVVFLTKQASWAAMNTQTQLKAVKSMLVIASGAAGELELEFNKKPSSRPRLQALQSVIKTIGQGLSVIGNFVGNPALAAEADKLKAFNTLTPPAQWKMTVNEINAAYSKAFKIEATTTSQPAK